MLDQSLWYDTYTYSFLSTDCIYAMQEEKKKKETKKEKEQEREKRKAVA